MAKNTSIQILIVFSLLFAVSCIQANAKNSNIILITNARIITGTGTVLDSGSVLIHEGKILQVSGDADQTKRQYLALQTDQNSKGRVIDGSGMTVMPGLIDTHRHIALNRKEFAKFLQVGITTVMDMAAWQDSILTLKNEVTSGKVAGPGLLVVGPAFTSEHGWPTPICRDNPKCFEQFVVTTTEPEALRERIRQLAEAGVDAIKVMYQNHSTQGAGVTDEVFRIIAAEAHKQGLDVVVHCESVDDTLRAIALGADRFAHTPLVGQVAGTDLAAQLVARNIPVATTVSWQTQEAQAAIGQAGTPESIAKLNNILANVRSLWDAGVVVAFGTDSPYMFGNTGFMEEVEALNKVLSREEVIASLTYNAAKFLKLDKETGTLEPGKQADLLMLSGNPLDDLEHLRDVKLVIKGGTVVVNNL